MTDTNVYGRILGSPPYALREKREKKPSPHTPYKEEREERATHPSPFRRGQAAPRAPKNKDYNPFKISRYIEISIETRARGTGGYGV